MSKTAFIILATCILLTQIEAAPICDKAQKTSVLIYDGPGVSQESLHQTNMALETIFGSHYKIKKISPEQLISTDWEDETALLVFPGGADIPYTIALNGDGNRKIHQYVKNGGAFLGICAGSYYSGNYVEFACGTELEVKGERELSFFPGIVRGPILAPYNYKNPSGARAAKVIWGKEGAISEGDFFYVYYNGGGYFVDAAAKENIAILAKYDSSEDYAAIIECRIGKGKAILSGVHFEYDPNLLDSQDLYLKIIIPTLLQDNLNRLKLLNHLIERLI